MNKFAVIFDMDGVIADNYKFHQAAWMEFCKRHKIDFEKAFRSRVFGGTNKDHFEAFFSMTLSEREIKEYEEEKEAIYRELYKPHVQPVQHLDSFLAKLNNAEIPVALATSAPPVNVDFILEMTGFEQYFQTILNASHVTRGKPDPEIYLQTAKTLNISPSSCIVIEDSENGIEAAKRAGMKVIGVTTTLKEHELPEVDLAIKDFEVIGIDDLVNLL